MRVTIASFLVLTLTMIAGCSQSAPPGDVAAPTSSTDESASDEQSGSSQIWIDVNDNSYGSIGSVTGTAADGTDTYKYNVRRAHFGDLLEDIAETTETTLSCSAPSLLDKGVTLEFEGATAAELIDDLAAKLDLSVSETAPNQFSLSPKK